jgi:hypothetical protein
MLRLLQLASVGVPVYFLVYEWRLTENPLAAGFVGLILAAVVTRCWLVWVKGARQVYDPRTGQYSFRY